MLKGAAVISYKHDQVWKSARFQRSCYCTNALVQLSDHPSKDFVRVV